LETLQAMQGLFREGRQVVWVAPSGGRDRPAPDGTVSFSTFDPKTVQMFSIVARKAKIKTHYFPMALFTYPICPPPDTVGNEMGERRTCASSPVGVFIGREIADDGGGVEGMTKAAMDAAMAGYLRIRGTLPQ